MLFDKKLQEKKELKDKKGTNKDQTLEKLIF